MNTKLIVNTSIICSIRLEMILRYVQRTRNNKQGNTLNHNTTTTTQPFTSDSIEVVIKIAGVINLYRDKIYDIILETN